LLGALLLAACTRAPKTELERGASVYVRTCASCHGIDGTAPAVAQSFKVPPPDLTDPGLHARLGSAGILQTIREGKGQMPAFGKLLPEDDLAALVTYVGSLSERPVQR
jgi:mono/diheme cytochrome c family protein